MFVYMEVTVTWDTDLDSDFVTGIVPPDLMTLNPYLSASHNHIIQHI